MELKSRDLRIGNYVYYPLLKVNLKITPSNLCDFSNGFIHFTPIPITEDILLNCGFERINKSRYLRKGSLTICIEPNNIFRFSLDGSFIVNLEFLHDLQNLIFALTKTELTINL